MHLLAHKIGKAYVGGPHGFLEADGIVHHAQQGAVPDLPGIVHKHAVAAFDQGGGAPRGQGGGDLCGLRRALGGLAGALAVEQTKVALRGEGHMAFYIGYGHAQGAGAAVHVQRAGQKNGALARLIKIGKGKKVHEQGIEVGVQKQQLFQSAQGIQTRCGFFALQAGQKALPYVVGKQGVQIRIRHGVQGLLRRTG